MNTLEYAKMAEREQSYWWHIGRLEIIKSYLEQYRGEKKSLKILNVGCGTGGTIKLLESYGTTQNVDVSDEAIKYMKKSGFKNITKISDITLPFKDKSFDLVVAFDVLEHIEEQEKALREWSRVLKKDGRVFITVPAYQWLWSTHDVSLQHKRRYTAKKLADVATANGLHKVKHSYAIVFTLPIIVAVRLLKGVLPEQEGDSESSYVNLPPWLNQFFTNVLFIEAKLHKHISFPFGTSVIGVFKKDGSLVKGT